MRDHQDLRSVNIFWVLVPFFDELHEESDVVLVQMGIHFVKKQERRSLRLPFLSECEN